MIYAVVAYPKHITLSTMNFDFNIYSKQSSNKEKMLDYYQEIKQRHGASCYVHLVNRESAKGMRKKWNQMLLERDQKYIENYKKNFSKNY